ncbi:MAG: MFS transporter [Victivallaceae bacterium]|nr:MFS transporter [Victivallaceae bacterium]
MSKLDLPQKSWICYDMANAAFALIVRTVCAPLYFKSCADGVMNPADATGYWGLLSSLAGIVAGVLSPWLGAAADAGNCRKKYFAGFLIAGLVATAGLAGTGSVYWVMGLYFVALCAYMGANSLYDSMIVDVAAPREFDRLSSLAYGWGYVGGLTPFVLFALPAVFLLGNQGNNVSFIAAAIWWGGLSLPLFFNVHSSVAATNSGGGPMAGLKRLAATAREIGRYRNAVVFLVAYFLFIDGVGTILLMATPISVDIGIPEWMLLVTVFGLQILGFPFTLLYGRLARKFDARKLVYAAIGVYMVIAALVGILPFIDSSSIRITVFLVAAGLIGTSQGGIQALSRSLFGRLIPPGMASEFFGFYNIFGKFTTVLGPVLIWLAVESCGHSEYGIALLIVPFAAGAWLLSRVKFE